MTYQLVTSAMLKTTRLWNKGLTRAGLLHPNPLIQVDSNGALIDRWLLGKSPHSQRAYRQDIAYFLSFLGDKPIPAITLDDLLSYADALSKTLTQPRHPDTSPRPISRNTYIRRLNGVRSLFRFAEERRVIVENPAKYLQEDTKGWDKRSERILTESQVLMMIAMEPNPRNQLLLRLLYDVGCRVSELCGLRWKHLRDAGNGDGLVSIYGKGNKKRDIRFHAQLWENLQAHKGSTDLDAPIFVSRQGNPLSDSQVRHIVIAAAKRVGIQHTVTPHWLRHCNATHAMNRGASAALIQANHGHSDLSVTTGYLHANPSDSVSFYLPR